MPRLVNTFRAIREIRVIRGKNLRFRSKALHRMMRFHCREGAPKLVLYHPSGSPTPGTLRPPTREGSEAKVRSGAGGRSNGYDDPRRWSEAKVKEDFGRSRRVMERIHAGGLESRDACQQQSSSLPRSIAQWPIELTGGFDCPLGEKCVG